MEQSLDKKIELKDRIFSFCGRNKYKIYFFVTILIITVISLTLLDTYKKNNNKNIAEKYIQAGIYLSAGKKEKAQKFYEEIIVSKNKFYSILSLNTVLEKNLEPNKEKILSYFRILEKMSISKDQKDILILKKSLYFMDQSNKVEGEKLLKSLINSNSIIKSIAEEILHK